MKRQIFHKALSLLICFSFLATSQIFAVHVSASSGASYCDGNNTYQVLADNKSVKLTWNGFYQGEDITIPASVTFPGVSETYNVTTVGDDMFDGHNIGKVTADHITTIETDAFKNSSITGITLKNSGVTLGNYVFYNCPNLTTVDLSGVESMGTHVFQQSGLQSATIPPAITVLPSCTFCDCSKLATVNLPEKMEEIADNAFNNSAIQSIKMPASLTAIGDSAFQNSKLNKIDMPTASKALSLAANAFYGCPLGNGIDLSHVASMGNSVFQNSGLQSVTIPSAITVLPSCTFYGCSKLATANLPEQMTEIADNAFNNSAIQSIKMPASLTAIGESAFQNSKLNKIDMPTASDALSLAANAFYGCPLGNGIDLSHVASMGNGVFQNSGLESVTVPSSIHILPSNTFMGCLKLKNLTLPDSMTKISDHAINGTGISTIALPKSLTGIGENAFQGSASLDKLVIPSQVASIGDYAFYSCPSLKAITFESVNPPAFGADVFGGSTNLKDVYVPSGMIQNYRSVLPANVNIIEKAVASISMKTKPDKLDYITGQNLDLSGASITASYNDGTKADVSVTPEMVSGYDAGKSGSQTVTVAYEGAQCTFEVNTAKKAVASISMKTKPNKLDYITGQNLDLSGASVTAFYNDGTKADVSVTPEMVSGYDAGKSGSQTVTVAYGGAQCTFEVNAAKKVVTSISMKTKPDKLDYITGQNLDLSGASVTASYNDGTKADVSVTPEMVSGYDAGKLGSQTVTVAYGGAQCTFEVNVASVSVSDGTLPNPKTGSKNWLLIPLALLGGSAVCGVIIANRRKIFMRK